jgi:hypothetical protein
VTVFPFCVPCTVVVVHAQVRGENLEGIVEMWTIGMAVTMVSPFPTTAACSSSVSTSFRNGEFALARLQSITRTLRCCRAHPSSLGTIFSL